MGKRDYGVAFRNHYAQHVGVGGYNTSRIIGSSTASGGPSKKRKGGGKMRVKPKPNIGAAKKQAQGNKVSRVLNVVKHALEKQSQSTGQHNDMDKTSKLIVLRPKRKWFNELGKFQIVVQRAFRQIVENTGTQNVFELLWIGSLLQLYGTAVGSGTSMNADRLRNNYFDYNPSESTTGGEAPGLTATTTQAADKIILRTVDYEVTLMNASNVSCEVQVLWFLCRKNTTKSVIETWQDSMDNLRLAQGGATAPTSADNRWQFNEGYATTQAYGTVPTQFTQFRKYWKLMSKDKFVLPPGDNHRIKFRILYNKVLDKAIAAQANASNDRAIAGYTLVPLVIARGALVLVNGPTPNFVKTASFAATELAAGVSVTHNLSSLGTGRTSYNRFSAGMVSEKYTGVSDTIQIINDLDTLAQEVLG